MGRLSSCVCQKRDAGEGRFRSSCKKCALRHQRVDLSLVVSGLFALSALFLVLTPMSQLFYEKVFFPFIGMAFISLFLTIALDVRTTLCDLGHLCDYCEKQPYRQRWKNLLLFFGCRYFANRFRKEKSN